MAINITATGSEAGACPAETDPGAMSAQASRDGQAVVVRLLNEGGARNYTLDINFESAVGSDGNVAGPRATARAATVTAQTIAHADPTMTNTPSEPVAVVPGPPEQLSGLPVAFEAPANSVTVFTARVSNG